jgi:hypothetical protein
MASPTFASIPDFSVPDDLTERDQWVLWRYETRNERPTKVPCQVSRKWADVSAPSTWTTFEAARNEWRRNPRQYAGLGFVFSKRDPFAGIDLDDSLDEQGDVKTWARGVIERFSDTYTEISPSGRGLKIWARGSLPANLAGVRVENGAIEMYDHARYFTVTGRAFRGAPLAIEDHASDVLTLYDHLTPGRKAWPVQPLPGGKIPHGQQHNTLVSLCGTLRARHICDEAIEACLQIVNEKQCETPGSREHITRIVRSSHGWESR